MENVYSRHSQHQPDERRPSGDILNPLARPKKRQRSSVIPAEPIEDGDNSNESMKLDQSEPKSGDSGRLIACPFYKRDPKRYGGANGCASWASADIDTVLRHHVLTTHKKLNDRLHHIDASRFEKVKGLKPKVAKLNKQQKAELLWKAAYKELFQPNHTSEVSDILVPDPYFRPNTASLDFDTLLKCMQERTNHNPLFVVESVDFLSEVKELEAKRDRERDEACEEAASEEAKVRKRRGERLQEIDGRYNMLLSDARRRYLESLTSRPEGGTDAGISSSPGPTSGIRVGAESSTLIATHTHSLPDSSPGGHDSALRLSSDTLNSFTSPRNDPPLQYDAPQTSSDVDLSNILDGGYEWDASMLSQSLYYEMDETMVSVEGQKDTSQ